MKIDYIKEEPEVNTFDYQYILTTPGVWKQVRSPSNRRILTVKTIDGFVTYVIDIDGYMFSICNGTGWKEELYVPATEKIVFSN